MFLQKFVKATPYRADITYKHLDEKRSSASYPVIYPAMWHPAKYPTQSQPITCPLMCHPIHSMYGVTIAHEMTTTQTSLWIWTLGFRMGWQEAERYSMSFKEQAISGYNLPKITVEFMKSDLGIKNHIHCLVIKSAIEWLFPSFNPFTVEVFESENESASWEMKMFNSGMGESNSYMNITLDSTLGRSTSGVHMNSIAKTENPALRSRQLILTLRPEQQVTYRQIDHLKRKFSEFNYIVEIGHSSTKPGAYVVVFENDKMAQEANVRARDIGFKLSKYRPKRPSPTNRVRFEVLRNLEIREGKSMNGEIVGEVNEKDVIVVNQTKGRRARIVSYENGKWVNFGWVSKYSEVTGVPHLKRID